MSTAPTRVLLAFAALLAPVLIALIAGSTAADDVAPGIAQEPVTIIARDMLTFEPEDATVVPGQQVIVVNEGFLQHDLNVDEWGVSTGLLDSGTSATFTVPDDAEVGATVVFYCSVPGHREAGMEGTFTVVEPPVALPGTPISELDRLDATISALEQEHADLAATATAIADQQRAIEERLVALKIQRDALIEATAAAEQTPAAPTEPTSGTSRPARQSATPTVTPAS